MDRKREEAMRALLLKYGQDHCLKFWPDLNEASRQKLLAQLESFDFELLDRLIRGESSAAGPPSLAELEEPDVITLPQTEAEVRRRDAAGQRGLEAIKSGRVAVLVVAGGQGTRLGFDGPKGCFPIGPVTNRTLFQIHAEKILAASRRAGRPIPWYIMTSETNDRATRDFLRSKSYFGLHPEDVFIFQQDMMPAVSLDGKLLLEAPDRVFAAPNGHGGVLKALHRSGALEDMINRGVEHVYYFQVDNPLLPVPDPVFLGYHIELGSEMSSKVLRKRSADEPIGTVVARAGRTMVLEYSDIPPEIRDARKPDGSLLFPFGSIAIHALAVRFIEKFVKGSYALPFHRAKKKIPYIDESGRRVVPAQPNGIKFEMFVFDALPFAERTVTVEVRREDEFAPVKNATGEDSVDSSRKALSALYARWLEACGVRVERSPDGTVGALEISPLTADSPEELARRLPPGLEFRDGLVL